MTQGQFFCGVLHIWIQSFPSEAEEPSLPYYLPIAGGRIIGFIPFQRVLVLCEMRSVSSRIWTRVAMPISYNNFTTGIYIYIYIYTLLYIYIQGSLNKFPYFFLYGHSLLIVHIWNSSPLQSNLLQLQYTCCTIPTTSGRPPWKSSSQPLSSPQLSHNNNLGA